MRRIVSALLSQEDLMSAQFGTVLVADPDAPVRMMLQHLLTEAGYHVLACADAMDCYRLARRTRPQLMLVDISGRGRDAFWLALLQLHGNTTTRRTPLILMTTNVSWLAEAQDDLAAIGVRALPKPFDTTELLATVASSVRPPSRRAVPAVLA
jgi:CheY-like chemotaxis protein